MSQWKKVKIGDICKIVKGTTGIASAEPGEYPLVVTAEERKTCSSYQFDCEAVCIPLVNSSGHGKKSLKNVHYQSGKFALGTILCAVIPNNPEQLEARFLHQYLQFYKDTILVPLMKGAATVCNRRGLPLQCRKCVFLTIIKRICKNLSGFFYAFIYA